MKFVASLLVFCFIVHFMVPLDKLPLCCCCLFKVQSQCETCVLSGKAHLGLVHKLQILAHLTPTDPSQGNISPINIRGILPSSSPRKAFSRRRREVRRIYPKQPTDPGINSNPNPNRGPSPSLHPPTLASVLAPIPTPPRPRQTRTPNHFTTGLSGHDIVCLLHMVGMETYVYQGRVVTFIEPLLDTSIVDNSLYLRPCTHTCRFPGPRFRVQSEVLEVMEYSTHARTRTHTRARIYKHTNTS